MPFHITFPVEFYFLLAGMSAVVSWFFYRRYAAMSRGGAWLACLGTLCVAAGLVIRRIPGEHDMWGDGRQSFYWSNLCVVLLCLFGVPFVVRLWGKWMGGRATEIERQPGAASWRAWLAGRHVIYSISLAALAYQGCNIPLGIGLLILISALALYPAIQAIAQSGSAPASPAFIRPISAEREKVMDLLAAGRITAEECAELLNALGASATVESTRSTKVDSPQRLVLIGAGALLFSFFLPWFVIDPRQEMTRTLNGIQIPAMANVMSQLEGVTQQWMPGSSSLWVQRISGGDVSHGLGWFALLFGLLAATAPYLARGLEEGALRTLRFCALAAGSFIVVYLLSQNGHFASYGLGFAAVGYALEWIGMLQQFRGAQPSGSPAHA